MGVLMIVVLYFLQGPVGSAFGIVYGAMFVPLTYWLDRTKYRMDLKRAGQRGEGAFQTPEAERHHLRERVGEGGEGLAGALEHPLQPSRTQGPPDAILCGRARHRMRETGRTRSA